MAVDADDANGDVRSMTVPAPYGDTPHLLAERVAELTCPECGFVASDCPYCRRDADRAWLDSLPAPTPGSHESDLWNRGVHPAPNWPPDTFWREYHNAAAWSRANRKETAAQ